jgi:hypothetical protein
MGGYLDERIIGWADIWMCAYLDGLKKGNVVFWVGALTENSGTM